MASEKQIAANRRNAKLAKGPVSVPGKRRSSLNRLKLGAFAKSSLLPTEDAEEFAKFGRGIYADWNPVGTTERTLVELLIGVLWRCRRLQTVEIGLYEMYRHYKEADGGCATAFVQDGLQVDSFGRLVKSESALERRMFRLIKELERLQAHRKARAVKDQ
jgi:hypothetical protein